MDKPTSSPELILESVYKVLEQSMWLFSRGEFMDFSLVEHEVKHLCMTINHLPTEEAQQYEPALQELIEAFSLCLKKLETEHAVLRSELEQMKQRVSVHKAYINNPGRTPYPPVPEPKE